MAGPGNDARDEPRFGTALRGGAAAVAAAALFGASAPFAKLLVAVSGPLALSALLYLGAGGALSLYRIAGFPVSHEAPLGRSDLPLLAGVIVLGAIAGPILMLLGLARISALAGSLMLNLEAPFTMVLAVAIFGEHLGLRAALSATAVVTGAALIGLRPGDLHADWLGAAEIAGACLAWGIDNNLAQRLSLRDPIEVARVKALGAGCATAVIALATGSVFPAPSMVTAALALGALSYGMSLVLDIRALRLLGAAREAAYFATAPFIGAIVSIPLFRQLPAVVDWAGALLMAAGVVLLLTERHAHPHAHEALMHEHLHVHDEHHRHSHEGSIAEPHSHAHRHVPLTHAHSHLPDLHHRHRHC